MTFNFPDKLYAYLARCLDESGISPSYGEITKAMGISDRSKSLITRSLRQLEKQKRVKLTKNGRRLQIALIANELPLLGKISAGLPIEAIETPQLIDLNDLFVGTDRFALRVEGVSMVEEGILDGDMIICLKSTTAKEGDIVVALIDQHNTTLKRISFKMKGMITLIPANKELKPYAYAPERIEIQGIYIGLVRTC